MTIDIDTATGPELVEEFNRLATLLGVTPTTRFADLQTGRRRVAKLTELLAQQGEAAAERAAEKAQKVWDLVATLPNEEPPADDPCWSDGEGERKPKWGVQRDNPHHRLNSDPNKKGERWKAFLAAIEEEADEDSGVIDTEAVRDRFPGVTTPIFAGWFRMAGKLGFAEKNEAGDWVLPS